MFLYLFYFFYINHVEYFTGALLNIFKMYSMIATTENSNDGQINENRPDSINSPDKGDGPSEGLGTVVANHYNSQKREDLITRKDSRIYFMRNFNNWIKSVFINEGIESCRNDSPQRNRKLHVLDLCCGKGGDIKKWAHGFVSHVTFADIAETSIQICKERYDTLRRKNFTAEFIVADCTKTRIREKFKDVTKKYDLVSCQFAFHYCFESLAQAEVMLKNVTECLRTGGQFIGTMPNAAEIVRRLREKEGESFGNEVFKITPHCTEPFPLFGAKYDFQLEGVVNCPEFLVHFPTFVNLAKLFGLKLVQVSPISKFFYMNEDKMMGLLRRMHGLEAFPPKEKKLVAELNEYDHVTGLSNVGTLSVSEWEAVSLYLLFTFEKIEPISYDDVGRPIFVE